MKRFWSWLPWILGLPTGWVASCYHLGLGWAVLIGAGIGVLCSLAEGAYGRAVARELRR